MVGWHHQLDGHEFEQAPGVGDRQGSLACCSPWACKESDTTERLHFHFSLSCIGEGNGNPLQCSCLENPRDRGTWWAAVYGVTQSWTRLKQLSSSSSSKKFLLMVMVYTLECLLLQNKTIRCTRLKTGKFLSILCPPYSAETATLFELLLFTFVFLIT